MGEDDETNMCSRGQQALKPLQADHDQTRANPWDLMASLVHRPALRSQ
jgi:hypothetical protein